MTDRSPPTEAYSPTNPRVPLIGFGNFASIVCHEFGQPVAAIRNYVTLADRRTGDVSAVLRRIDDAVGEMQKLFAQLRAIPVHDMPDAEIIDAADLVRSAAKSVRGIPACDALRVDLAGLAPKTCLLGKSRQLEHAIANLLRFRGVSGNSPPEIRVVGRSDGSVCTVQVCGPDGAPRIAASEERFPDGPIQVAQVDAPTRMGAAIAAEIVRAHGGVCRMALADGSAACFELQLPQAL